MDALEAGGSCVEGVAGVAGGPVGSLPAAGGGVPTTLADGPGAMSALVAGPGELLDVGRDAGDDVVVDGFGDGSVGDCAPSRGDESGSAPGLALAGGGSLGGDPGSIATAASNPTMPRTDAAPIPFCKPLMFT